MWQDFNVPYSAGPKGANKLMSYAYLSANVYLREKACLAWQVSGWNMQYIHLPHCDNTYINLENLPIPVKYD